MSQTEELRCVTWSRAKHGQCGVLQGGVITRAHDIRYLYASKQWLTLQDFTLENTVVDVFQLNKSVCQLWFDDHFFI